MSAFDWVCLKSPRAFVSVCVGYPPNDAGDRERPHHLRFRIIRFCCSSLIPQENLDLWIVRIKVGRIRHVWLFVHFFHPMVQLAAVHKFAINANAAVRRRCDSPPPLPRESCSCRERPCAQTACYGSDWTKCRQGLKRSGRREQAAGGSHNEAEA